MVDKLGGPYRILLMDDDETIRDTLAMLLQSEGYIADEAENGKEAIEKTNQNFYNLAIVDWRLPDFEGTKLIGKLKETTPRMAKIMLTGFPSMQNAIDSVNNRADAFFLKPVDVPTLLAKIKELLKQQEESRAFDDAKMVSFIETRAKELLQAENKTDLLRLTVEWVKLPKPVTDEIIINVIDKGLDTLGASAKQALWYYLEKDFGFGRQKSPSDIDAFQDALQKFFGIGYSFLETLFKQYLQEATGETFPAGLNFAACVHYLYANKPAA